MIRLNRAQLLQRNSKSRNLEGEGDFEINPLEINLSTCVFIYIRRLFIQILAKILPTPR
jgi:hypothetical protein